MEEVTREEPAVSFVSSVSDLLLIEEPTAGEFVGPLTQQPRLQAVDELVRHTEGTVAGWDVQARGLLHISPSFPVKIRPKKRSACGLVAGFLSSVFQS